MSTIPSTSPTDLSRDEILLIAERIDRALERRSLLPFQSLQYRLGETGQKRVHPFALRRSLAALARKPTRRSTVAQALQPWIMGPHLYASPGLTAAEADAELLDRRADLQLLSSVAWKTGFQQLIETIEAHVGTLERLEDGDPMNEAPLADGPMVESLQAFYRLPHAGECPLYLWITHQPGWIHPMDRSLWSFLGRCAADGAQPLVLARYIDPVTFVLFEAMGMRGNQYYAVWTSDDAYAPAASASERLGWFYVQAPEKKANHRVFSQLARSIEHGAENPFAESHAKVRDALTAGLGRLSGGEAVEALLTWAREMSPPLPQPWIETLERWRVWLEDGPVKLSGRSKRTSTRSGGRSKPSSPAPDEPESEPITSAAPDGDDEQPRGFGRKTTITRVPFRLR